MISIRREHLAGNREQVFRQLYRTCFPAVARKLKQLGANQEDTEDIFQDSLIVLYEKSRQGKLPEIDHPSAYLQEVARRLWLKKTGQADRNKQSLEDAKYEIPADFYQKDDTENRVLRYLERAGQKCMELLQAFYYHEWSLGEIARNFGYSSVRSATVQKYKCLEKVRAKVQEKELEYEQ